MFEIMWKCEKNVAMWKYANVEMPPDELNENNF
jgi:hypothetical protein